MDGVMFVAGIVIAISAIIYLCLGGRKRRGSTDNSTELPADNSGSRDNAH